MGAFSVPVEQFLEEESLARLAAGVQKGVLAPQLHFHNRLESIKNSAASCERVAALPQK